MTAPGEYRLDLTAVYTDANGVMWMGTRAWANVIETPGTPLLAHGRRGLDILDESAPSWFLNRNFSFSGVAHTTYPYFNGDILWSRQSDQAIGGDIIVARFSVQDTVGTIADIIQGRANRHHPPVPTSSGYPHVLWPL